MIAYRYCSNEELQRLNEKGKIKGFHYESNPEMSTHLYDAKMKYLHFYLDEANMYCFDDVEPENLVEFRFPNEFDEFRGIGNYYVMDKDYNVKFRSANQLAIPDYLVKKEYVKNIEAINTPQEYEDRVKRLIHNHL
ncbi:MAG: hypothetical protein K6E99_00815 [Bacilli bacterium]|nr:hypothetical protein [Bacilli bacterium]